MLLQLGHYLSYLLSVGRARELSISEESGMPVYRRLNQKVSGRNDAFVRCFELVMQWLVSPFLTAFFLFRFFLPISIY